MIEDHNLQKKAAVINDFSSFGRCSLAVSIPILAAMKVQCCSVPTALFTNHTGFQHSSFYDFSAEMDRYIEDWKATGIEFKAIQTGFLASLEQLAYVKRFISAFKSEKTIVLVDPVMGDYGKLYRTFKNEVAEGLRSLVDEADYLTPNLTEASILLGVDYDPQAADDELFALASRLSEGKRGVVISGISRGEKLLNFVVTKEGEKAKIEEKKIGPDRSGTGDVFSSVILGALLNGETLIEAVKIAADFVVASVKKAEEIGIPTTDGLPIEETLPILCS